MSKTEKVQDERLEEVISSLTEENVFKNSKLNKKYDNSIVFVKPEVVEGTVVNMLDLYSADKKEIDFLIKGMIPKRSLGFLTGASSSGKSMLARQMAICCVTKSDFLDHEGNFDDRKVLYITTEEAKEHVEVLVKNQIDGFGKKVTEKEMKRCDFVFDSFDVYKDVKRLVEEEENDYQLIIIDAFGDVIKGDSNSNEAIRNTLSDYKKIINNHDCVILFTHHLRKNGEYSSPHKNSVLGSQAITAVARFVYDLRYNKRDNEHKLTCVKSNLLPITEIDVANPLTMSENLIFTPVYDKKTKVKKEKKTQKEEMMEEIIKMIAAGKKKHEIIGKRASSGLEITEHYYKQGMKEFKEREG